MNNSIILPSFSVKCCSFTPIATGEEASSLLDLRNKLSFIDEKSIYYHFFGHKLKSEFISSLYHNDFANWVFFRLHDQILAEKLNLLDPNEFATFEDLREELIEIIENHLENSTTRWTSREEKFHFIRSTLMVFDSDIIFSSPKDLAQFFSRQSLSSIFYHFMDAPKRNEERLDDISLWLKNYKNEFQDLVDEIQSIDPFLISLSEYKEELNKKIQFYFSK